MEAKEASWIPFHVVACSSEEHGTKAEQLATTAQQGQSSAQRSWESSRTGSFPVELVLRFHYRAEIHHILLACKPDKDIPHVEFLIGDGWNGSFVDTEYRLAGKASFVQRNPVQVKLQGIGNYLKIRIVKASDRTASNPFGQVSLSILKVWGRYTNYMTKLKNEEIPMDSDKSNIDKLLIGMGIPVDMINWFDEDARMYEHAPMDEDTRVTLNDLIKIRDKAVKNEDYEGLKALAEDVKTVFEIGKEIWSIKREINFAIAKEDYPRAVELKKRLRELESKRDGFDALYETSRYESSIVLDRPTTADYMKIVGGMDDEERRKAEERRRQREAEEAERRRQYEEYLRQQELLRLANMPPPEEAPPLEVDDKGPAWWEKNGGVDLKLIKKEKKKKKEEDETIEVNFKNPLAFNEGDIDLEMYLKPLLAQAGEKVPDISSEILRHLYHLGFLQVFGAKCWSAIYSENWRHREAAAQAVLNFIEMPLPEKYLNGKSKKLFGACMRMAKIACSDKILQVYFIGLKILSTALAPPVCGTDVSPKMINDVLKEFTPILIEKISELNFRSRDISLHTLLQIFKHPAAEIGTLINSCLEICIENPNFSSLYVPPSKQPHRIMMARLEIILNILQESGYDDRQWNWSDVFHHMLVPCLFHPSNEIRLVAIEIIVALYQLIGSDVRDQVDQIENLKPNLMQMILERLDAVKELAEKNQKQREDNILSLVKEMDPRLEHTPPNSNRPNQGFDNEFVNINDFKQTGSKPAYDPKKDTTPVVVYAIDGIHNVLESKQAHAVIATVMDETTTYYEQGKRNGQTRIISDLDWTGYLASPHFKPGSNTVVLEKRQTLLKSALVLEVVTLNPSKLTAAPALLGWTAVPLFEGDWSVVDGSFQVPLFKGPVDKAAIADMKFRSPWDVFAEKLSDKKNPLKYQEFATVLIRIGKGENSGSIGNSYSVEALDQRYLPPNKFKKWLFDKEQDAALQKEKKKLVSILPNANDAAGFDKKISDALAAAYPSI